MYRSPDQTTVMVLCICSTAQCKLVNTFFCIYYDFFFCRIKSFVSYEMWEESLSQNIGHCLFFTETNCTWKCFSRFVLYGDLTTQRGGVSGCPAAAATTPNSARRSFSSSDGSVHFFFLCTISETNKQTKKNWLQICWMHQILFFFFFCRRCHLLVT